MNENVNVFVVHSVTLRLRNHQRFIIKMDRQSKLNINFMCPRKITFFGIIWACTNLVYHISTNVWYYSSVNRNGVWDNEIDNWTFYNLALNKNKRTTELEAYQSLQAEAFEQTYVNKNTKSDKGSFVDIKKIFTCLLNSHLFYN